MELEEHGGDLQKCSPRGVFLTRGGVRRGVRLPGWVGGARQTVLA